MMPDKQLQRTGIRRRGRAASAPFSFCACVVLDAWLRDR